MTDDAATKPEPNGHTDVDEVPPVEEDELPPENPKEAESETGKIKTLLSILRKFVGVKDLANVRFSLPAHMLLAQANLEYWNYFDRPDMFAVIPDMEHPLDRMLAVVRYAFSKELKFYDGKVVKPFNSVLGEHFRCHWQFPIPVLDPEQGGLVPVQGLRNDKAKPLPLPSLLHTEARKLAAQKKLSAASSSSSSSSSATSPVLTATSEGPSAASSDTCHSSNATHASGIKKLSRLLSSRKNTSNDGHVREPTSSASSIKHGVLPPPALGEQPTHSSNGHANAEDRELGEQQQEEEEGNNTPPIVYLTQRTERRIAQLVEQVSHHPPVSCFFVSTDSVEASGVDQLSAKFTGSSIKIGPGEYAKGIFIKLKEGAQGNSVGEEYQATHATASINGILRGSLWLSVADHSYITSRGGSRPGPRYRSIIEYKDESWVGKAKYALVGIIYEYDPETEGADINERHRKLSDVSADKIKVHISGSWKGLITYRLAGSSEEHTLIDMNDLVVLPKQVRPLEEHEPLESRRVWGKVIDAINTKDYNRATKEKQIVEQRQRDEATARKEKNEEFEPQFFEKDYQDGRPTLKPKGREVVEGLLRKAGSTQAEPAAVAAN
ncbi:hypothetical protein OC846_006394 [Tilletia horrida]|uniref:Oxysterol-binding protein n=1 Tax=Tilletia horrida TaxID=155126 RepID=A0AAN6GK19_9BASI|nr:hypothetical protein OC845_006423 [Tilletia horrida]KAK0543505.1 hypothetical protein OC846_006394 [Tilletia horrida]